MAPKKRNILTIFTSTNATNYKKQVDFIQIILQRRLFESPDQVIVQIYAITGKTYALLFDSNQTPTIESIRDAIKQLKSKETKDEIPTNVIKNSLKLTASLAGDYEELTDEYKIGYYQTIILTENVQEQIPETFLNKYMEKTRAITNQLYLIGPHVHELTDVNDHWTFADVYNQMRRADILKSNPTLRSFILQTRALVCSLTDAVHLIEYYRPVINDPQPWRTNFRVCNDLNIPIVAYRFTVDEAAVPTSKEVTCRVESPVEYTDGGEAEMDEGPTRRINLVEAPKHVKVVDEDESEGDAGGEFQQFVPDTSRSLELLFTVDADNLHVELEDVGDAKYMLFAEDTREEFQNLFASFLLALKLEKKLAIVSRVYNIRNYPALFALKPVSDHHCLMVKMPFKDYMYDTFDKITRDTWKKPGRVEEMHSHDAVRACVTAFLEKLTVKRGELACALPFHMQFNTKKDFVYARLMEKFDPDLRLNDLEMIASALSQPERVVEGKAVEEDALLAQL